MQARLGAENTGALKDLRVIEMGTLIAGPFCGQLLGDMGAEVIKIEPPGAGDPMRVLGPRRAPAVVGGDRPQQEVGLAQPARPGGPGRWRGG